MTVTREQDLLAMGFQARPSTEIERDACIPEDPATGSSHCAPVPYWSNRLGKIRLHALQLSKRGGELFCEKRGERVKIAGRVFEYLQGEIYV